MSIPIRNSEGYADPTAKAALDKVMRPAQRFTIPGRLAGMNEYQRACRSHRMKGAKMKAKQQEIVEWAIIAARIKPFAVPVKVHIRWVEQDRSRDFDNITAASKWVLDALVSVGIIPDDGEKWVKGITHERGLDRTSPRVEVEIREAAP